MQKVFQLDCSSTFSLDVEKLGIYQSKELSEIKPPVKLEINEDFKDFPTDQDFEDNIGLRVLSSKLKSKQYRVSKTTAQ